MKAKSTILFFILVSGCASNPYSWEHDYYERDMIEKCKVHRPDDVAGCHLFVDQIFRVSYEDGFLYHRLDQVTASCIEKYPDIEIDTQRTCIREARKIIWNKYIEGIFKTKKSQ